jgi:hypothetical protein
VATLACSEQSLLIIQALKEQRRQLTTYNINNFHTPFQNTPYLVILPLLKCKFLLDCLCTFTVSIITLMMEAVSSSETSVNIYQTTQCNIPEESHLHTNHSENLKSHLHNEELHNLYSSPNIRRGRRMK